MKKYNFEFRKVWDKKEGKDKIYLSISRFIDLSNTDILMHSQEQESFSSRGFDSLWEIVMKARERIEQKKCNGSGI